ncbi:MAG TPA: DUF4399 domain-containing protein [Nevskia sp.]|nr:DUF4399 domain-containing protein [Nevskia sp.]
MNKTLAAGLLLSATLAVAGCSQKSPDQNQANQSKGAPAAPDVTNPNPAASAPNAPGMPPAGASSTAAPRQKAPEGTAVSFTGIKDGDTVTSPFKVGFAVTGAKIAPAGTADAGTGHFHLLIDTDTLPPQDAPLPASDKVKHYGKGQTEDTVTLPPGPHTLQIELADGAHVPFDPPVLSDKITVTVK